MASTIVRAPLVGPRLLLASCGVVVALAGCSGSNGGTQPSTTPVAIQVAPPIVNILDCDTVQLSAQFVDAKGDPVTGSAPITFGSLATTVATVSATGLVRGTGVGGTRILAASGALVDSVVTNVGQGLDMIALGEDSTRLAQGGVDTLNPVLHSCHGSLDSTTTLGYSSDHPTVAAVSAGGVVQALSAGSAVITISAGAAMHQFKVNVVDSVGIVVDASPALSSRPYGVAISNAGVGFVTRLDASQLTTVDVAGHTVNPTNILVGAIPTGVALSGNDSVLAVASQAGPIAFVSPASDSVTALDTIAVSAFNAGGEPGGAEFLVGTNASKVYVVSIAGHNVVDSIPAGPEPNWFGFRPGTNEVWIPDAADGTLRRVSTTTHAVIATTQFSSGLQGIAFSADGGTAYVATNSGWLLLLNGATAVTIDSVAIPGGAPFGVARRPGTSLIWVGTLTGDVDIVDPTLRMVVGRRHVGGTLRRMAFDSAGTEALIADENGRVIFAH